MALLTAVTVQISLNFTMGSTTSLFPLPKGAPYAETDDVTLYDISPDGQRFLLNAHTEKEKPSYTLVLNWSEALSKSE